MNKLLELEKKNQEYPFNYNCLRPINKKEFLLSLAKINNIDVNSAAKYDKFLNIYDPLIDEYYKQINKGIDPKLASIDCFNLDLAQIPLDYQQLTFQNSGILESRSFYLQNLFFNNEFNKYWVYIADVILNLTAYDIKCLNPEIIKNAFINMHKIKYNKYNKNLNDYFKDIENQVPQLSDSYNVDAKYLNNYPIMKLFATTLTCCESTLFDYTLRLETKERIKDLYLLLEPNALNSTKKVA